MRDFRSKIKQQFWIGAFGVLGGWGREGGACRAVVLAFGQLFVCPQFVAEHNCGVRAGEKPSAGLQASAWFDFIVTMLLAACVYCYVYKCCVCVCGATSD